MIGESYTLLSNSAAGNGAHVYINGGRYAFTAEATFGSAKLQIQLPNNTWVDVPSSTLTSAGYALVTLPAGKARAVGTGGSAYFCSLVKVPD